MINNVEKMKNRSRTRAMLNHKKPLESPCKVKLDDSLAKQRGKEEVKKEDQFALVERFLAIES